MCSSTPRISIVCPSFNHAKFIRESILSLLSQTERNIEVILIDDASTDGNLEALRGIADQRLRVIVRRSNMGVAAGMNEGFALARADIVCLFATDDIAEPHYVENVLAAFACHPEAVAVFVALKMVGPDGASLGKPDRIPASGSRLEILRNSFLGENQLPSPGMALRREIALDILLPEGTVQYSDWMLQNRILMRGEVVTLGEPLVLYRVTSSSLSARSLGSLARDRLETRIMMDDFLGVRSMDFWSKVFPEEIRPYASLPERHIPYVLGRLALLSNIDEKRYWGYETIMRHISEPGMAESLRQSANFTHKDLMALTPTGAAAVTEEARRLHRHIRRLKRAIGALFALILLLIWNLLR